MPSITININSMTYRIDSSDRDIVAAWLRETIARIPGSPADWVTFQLYPLYNFTPENLMGTPDWPILNAAWLGRQYPVNKEGVKDFYKEMMEALGQVVEFVTSTDTPPEKRPVPGDSRGESLSTSNNQT